MSDAMKTLRISIFLLLLAGAATPWCGPATALTAGILFSLAAGNPWPKATADWSRTLLQLSVVGLGFGVGITEVWHAGREAVLYTPVSICLTVAAGLLLGRMLNTSPKVSLLISFGTAICGGSAISAMAPVIEASDDDTAVSLATVFTLNAAALLLFPPLGQMLGMTERQFGLWSALAIHDTSSVVGAASAFGATALATGTTVKLARAVWIAPSALIASRFANTRTKARFPLFIAGFIIAAAIRAYAPGLDPLWQALAGWSRQGLVVTLFLIGAGLTREVFRRVGMRPLAQGVYLWIVVSVVVAVAVTGGLIR